MNPIEVLITLPMPSDLVAKIKNISPQLIVHKHPANSPDAIPPEIWAVIEVLYTDKVLPSLQQAPNLQWIQFHWAGIDHVTSNPFISHGEWKVSTMSGASATQVAEYVLMMMLALGHKLPTMIDFQKRVIWPKDRWEILIPRELRDSTVGIVGYGSIGRQVAHLLFPFGARVLATKHDVKNPYDTGYIINGYGDPNGDYVHRLYPPEALCSMVSECDFLIICVPLSTPTMNLIDEDVISAMKSTTFLIDVSRGGVVDHDALRTALRTNKIAGAALDVFPHEPLPPDSNLWNTNKIILTPHISGITNYYDERAMEMFAENIKRYLDGSQLYNQYNPDFGY